MKADGRITVAVAAAALARLNVDEFGLDDMDARILTTIIEKFGGGPVGLGTVAVAVGEDAGTLQDVYEPYLIQQGFLERTPRGRCATALPTAGSGSPRPPPGRRASLTAEPPPHRRFRLRPAARADRPGAAGGPGREPHAHGLRADRRQGTGDRRVPTAPPAAPDGDRAPPSASLPCSRDRRAVGDGILVDSWFAQLPSLIPAGDLLVLNTTRVRHARLLGTRPSGAPAEVLLIHPAADDTWIALGKPGSALQPGKRIRLDAGVDIETVEVLSDGNRRVRFVGATAEEAIRRFGRLPLPPYIDPGPDRGGRAALPDGLRRARSAASRRRRPASTSPPSCSTRSPRRAW